MTEKVIPNLELQGPWSERHGFIGNSQGQQIFWRHFSPEQPPVATLLVAHGYAEHSGRYRNVYNAVLPAGIEVYAVDHQGHGHSDGPRGYVERMTDFVEDMQLLYGQEIAPSLQGRSLFLLGHSMGSVIAMHYANRYSAQLNGLVLSGTGRSMAGTPKILTALAKVISVLVPKLPIKSPFANDFISHDPEVVQAYTQDPLVYAPNLTARLGAEMFQGCLDGAALLKKLTMPLLIVYGSEDSSFSGQQELFDAYAGADKKIMCYQGARHEVYNELPKWRDAALADLTTWLQSHLGATEA